MAEATYAQRCEQVLSLMQEAEIPALLVTNELNVTYLTGFTGDSSALLLAANHQLMITDTRYAEQISGECPGLRMDVRDSSKQMDVAVADAISSSAYAHIGVETHVMAYDVFKKMSELVTTATLVPTSGLVEKVRQVKDAWELEQIRRAVRLAERGFDTLRAGLRTDFSERQVAHQLEHQMRGFGANAAGFAPIVAVGSNSALPHARPGDRRVGESAILLVDWGAETQSKYRSDLTRVLVTGKAPENFEEIYNTVLKAQLAAIDAIRPDVACKDIDQIARDVIGQAGFGERFGHGLGHSFGLAIHETPRFSPISEDVLRPGVVMTVEPGIYVPGWGGIRIEDDVLVTDDGCEVLTSVPKQLEDVFVDLN